VNFFSVEEIERKRFQQKVFIKQNPDTGIEVLNTNSEIRFDS